MRTYNKPVLEAPDSSKPSPEEPLTCPWPDVADERYPLSVENLDGVPSTVGLLAKQWTNIVGNDVIVAKAPVDSQVSGV